MGVDVRRAGEGDIDRVKAAGTIGSAHGWGEGAGVDRRSREDKRSSSIFIDRQKIFCKSVNEEFWSQVMFFGKYDNK